MSYRWLIIPAALVALSNGCGAEKDKSIVAQQSLNYPISVTEYSDGRGIEADMRFGSFDHLVMQDSNKDGTLDSAYVEWDNRILFPITGFSAEERKSLGPLYHSIFFDFRKRHKQRT